MGATAYRYLRNRKGAGLFVLAFALLAVGRSASFGQWSIHLLEAGCVLALVIFLIRTCGLDLVGFGVAIFWLQVLTVSLPLVSQSTEALRWNGIGALVVSVAVGFLVLAGSRTIGAGRSERSLEA